MNEEREGIAIPIKDQSREEVEEEHVWGSPENVLHLHGGFLHQMAATTHQPAPEGSEAAAEQMCEQENAMSQHAWQRMTSAEEAEQRALTKLRTWSVLEAGRIERLQADHATAVKDRRGTLQQTSTEREKATLDLYVTMCEEGISRRCGECEEVRKG